MSDLQGNTQDKRRDPYPPERRKGRSGVAGKELSREHRRKLRTCEFSEAQIDNRLGDIHLPLRITLDSGGAYSFSNHLSWLVGRQWLHCGGSDSGQSQEVAS